MPNTPLSYKILFVGEDIEMPQKLQLFFRIGEFYQRYSRLDLHRMDRLVFVAYGFLILQKPQNPTQECTTGQARMYDATPEPKHLL